MTVPLTEGPDRWIRSVKFDVGNRFKIREDQDGDGTYETEEEIDIPTGRYWGHDDSTLSNLPGLYDKVRVDINSHSSLDETYQIRAQTPTNSDLQESGLEIVGGATPFELDFGYQTATFDPRLFGFTTFQGNVIQSSLNANSNHSVESDASIPLAWQTFTRNAHNGARSKFWDEERDYRHSSSDDENSFQIEHGTPQQTRMFEYRDVPAAHVRDGKANYSGYASLAGIPTGEINNTYYRLWDEISRKSKVIVVHAEGDVDLDVSSHDYEYGYLARQYRSSFEAGFEMMGDGELGEFYNMEIGLLILGGSVITR